jgi:hypothetical protein
MARWTGNPEIVAVLDAGKQWFERCLQRSDSAFTGTGNQVWTLANVKDLYQRFSGNPLLGDREFLDKFQEQLGGAPPAIHQLAAEALWFVLLFPDGSVMKQETKRDQIRRVWEWSGTKLPSTPLLSDAALSGVGHPGTAYMTHRPLELAYLLTTVIAYKSLPLPEMRRLLADDVPWAFAKWLDDQEGSSRRLVRNALAYLLFPDFFERNTSRDHRQQIYASFKDRLPQADRITSRNPALNELDKAIYQIRKGFESERKTVEFDFYQSDIKAQWFASFREGKQKNFRSWLNTLLEDRGLQFNVSGRDTTIEKLAADKSISTEAGFWTKESGLTAKPPRWILHFDIRSTSVEARIPKVHRSGVLGFANTKGGNSGALGVRILPVAQVGDKSFEVLEKWEWMLVFCFPGGLKPGSAAQTFDDFDPQTGKLTYMGESIPYIYAALLCLNGEDESFQTKVAGKPVSITYGAATKALVNLIRVSGTEGTRG